MKTRHVWTWVETQLLVRCYADACTQDLAEVLGIGVAAICRKANQMGLRKSHEFLASEASGRMARGDHKGRQTQFKPGLVPWNKGKHHVAGGRSAETRFKAGQLPHTWRPVGSLRITDDGYLQRKVTDTRYPPRDWVPVHRLVWEAKHGPVPAGHVVVFKPGRRTTVEAEITPDTVELVTRGELMKRNSVHNMPKELAELIQLRGALNRKINARSKQ